MISISGKNCRGTGILVSKNLAYSIPNTFKDDQENILSLDISIDSYVFRCIAVYGPNNNDRNFFIDLNRACNQQPALPTVIGGDWNMTVSTINSDQNIDILNMNNPPSIFRSRLLYDFCTENNLTDPYRVLHPTRRDFTYVPRSGAANRSRIDFFIISTVLCNALSACDIAPNLSTALFDHKLISLKFTKMEQNNNISITNSTINHIMFTILISTTVFEVYLQHADTAPGADPDLIRYVNENLPLIGRASGLMLQINDLEWKSKMEGLTDDEVNRKEALFNDLTMITSRYPDPELLNLLPVNADPDIFFEVLSQSIMNSLKSFQGWLSKLNRAKKIFFN
jgi:exonuclease III